MPYFQNPSRLTLFARKWAKPALFIFSFILIVSFPFLLDYSVKNYIESYSSRVNGAQVTIRDFDLSLLRGTCRMGGIEVTHHTQAMRNLIELDEVKLTFERLPLFAFKLIIPVLNVEGVRYNTPRERSGVLESDDLTSYPTTALLDRIVPGVYDSVRTSVSETPLRNLAALTVGIAMRNSVAPNQNDLEIPKKIKAVDLDLDQLLSTWDRENERIAHSTGPREERIEKLQTLRSRIQKETALLNDRADHIFDSLNGDTEYILRKIGVPPLNTDDFTRHLLGRRTLNHLERIAYWIEMSRRKMGIAGQMGIATASMQASVTGNTGTEPKPRLVIYKTTIHSTAGTDRHKGDIHAEITDLASQPMAARPLRIDFSGDFPGLLITGIKLHAVFNHSIAEPREDIDFSLGSFPLSDWAVEETPELTLAVATGTASMTFHTRFVGPTMNANWTVLLNNADFKISSRYALMERTLREVLNPLAKTIAVKGALAGAGDKMEFNLESNAGHQLATALSERFRAPLHTASETVQDEINDRFKPQVKRLEYRILNATSRLERRLSDSIDLLTAKAG